MKNCDEGLDSEVRSVRAEQIIKKLDFVSGEFKGTNDSADLARISLWLFASLSVSCYGAAGLLQAL
jgi:hypothetical protein